MFRFFSPPSIRFKGNWPHNSNSNIYRWVYRQLSYLTAFSVIFMWNTWWMIHFFSFLGGLASAVLPSGGYSKPAAVENFDAKQQLVSARHEIWWVEQTENAWANNFRPTDENRPRASGATHRHRGQWEKNLKIPDCHDVMIYQSRHNEIKNEQCFCFS